MALKVFVDFDGTITRQDVGNVFFRTFGGEACDRLIERYHAGEISAQECFRGEAEAMGRVRPEALHAVIDAQEIDPGFPRFVEFCQLKTIELLVLSDGLDFYLRRILDRHGLPHVRFVANTLSLVDEDDAGTVRMNVSFPHSDAECDRCACCKRNIMLTLTGEEDTLCYVGEGFSDRCPARYADVVFAKDALQTYCREENISYYPYASFDDVTARLSGLLARPRLRHRRRAELCRRAAFRQES